MKRFEDLVGQLAVKRQLLFYHDAWKATKRMPNVLLSAPKGTGKTEFAKRFARKLTDSEGKPRPFVEINCGVLKKADDFFEVIYPNKIADRSVTVLFDECHALPNDLETAFLTLFSVNTDKRARLSTANGFEVVLDFESQSFFFATTESHKVFEPLKNRLDEITFDFYTDEEMGRIFSGYCNVTVERSVLPKIVNTLRGVARAAVKIADKVNMYCSSKKIARFGAAEWADLCKIVGVLPWGITPLEIRILETLKARGATSLQGLCAATGMSRASLLYSGENGLLGLGMLDKDATSKRFITAKGIGALSEALQVRKTWA
jgi:Holliday junction resolvasome RuvABC ATP-dependent DNA helicase subunit